MSCLLEPDRPGVVHDVFVADRQCPTLGLACLQEAVALWIVRVDLFDTRGIYLHHPVALVH